MAAREEASILEEEAKEQEARAMRKKQEAMEEEDIQVRINAQKLFKSSIPIKFHLGNNIQLLII